MNRMGGMDFCGACLKGGGLKRFTERICGAFFFSHKNVDVILDYEMRNGVFLDDLKCGGTVS